MTVRLWDAQTGKRLCDPLYGHTVDVSSVKFTPGMKQLITGAPVPSSENRPKSPNYTG
jgi:WD40 repeat protein